MPFLNFTLTCPIPAHLPPERVLDALCRYEPLITPNPFLVSYRRRPVVLDEIVDDPFFREDGQALAAFEVVDRIVFVPGLPAKQVVIPCVMQRFDGGVRCRSFAAGGVRVWSTWRVLPAAEVTAAEAAAARSEKDKSDKKRSRSASQSLTPPATPPTTTTTTTTTAAATDGYALVEDARVECGSLVKPFVSRSFRESHQAILRKVLADVASEM